MGLAEVTTLVTGATALRLAGDAILALWRHDADGSQSRVGAARELLARARAIDAWYGRLETALAGGGLDAARRLETMLAEPARLASGGETIT